MSGYQRPEHLSRDGAEFIGRFEGLRLEPYNDPAGFATIGYGHLLHRSNVTAADRAQWRGFTAEKALNLLQQDAASASRAVHDHVKARINQAQHDALVSFVFNVGAGAFATSTLLRLLNTHPGTTDGVVGQAALREVTEQLEQWARAGGQVLPGLLRRRQAEARLFKTGRYA